jgi:hypothetical protein
VNAFISARLLPFIDHVVMRHAPRWGLHPFLLMETSLLCIGPSSPRMGCPCSG